MSAHTLEGIYLAAAVCFILALKGLSGPKTARRGNLLGAAGALLAIVSTFFAKGVDHNRIAMIVAIIVGAAVGVYAARGVKMTAMPQLVAAFNGVGGAAAAIVSIAEFHRNSHVEGWFAVATVVFSALVGFTSFTGSVLTFAKLQELITGRPITFPGAPLVTSLVGLGAVGCAVAVVPSRSMALLIALAGLSLVFGLLFVLPVGGADVPIVISLLNAFTGLAVAASGYVLGNTVLLIGGTLVGASGTVLTQLMARAMGRSITNILFGAFKGGAAVAAAGAEGDRSVRSASAEDVAILLAYARKVIVVPGYGLAVAQAQHALRELVELLEGRGVEVAYGIHPVAGRMPGHMNVLLAEANVPYESLKEMDDVNPQFQTTDVALVIGANDVVNPAARDQPGSPIYGMPILDVDSAKAIVFLKRSMRPGFAGIDNALLFNEKTTLLFGDAKDSLTDVISQVKTI